MRYIIDLTVIIVYSLFALFFTELNLTFVFLFLTALILSCLVYLYPSQKFCLFAGILYLVISVFFPPAMFPLPILLYSLIFHNIYWLAFCYVPVICYHAYITDITSTSGSLLFLFGIFLSWFLQYNTRKYESLDRLYKKTLDDSVERNLLLSEKNQALIEKQDYEIYTATLRERNRIAREIHDNVGHLLSRSILMLGAIKTINQNEALEPPLETLDESLNDAMSSIRRSVHDLHDDAVNLEEALRSLVSDFTFCPLSLNYDMEHHVSREIRYAFISIVKEALANIMKHSHADRAAITLREHPALYQLSIEDNGTESVMESGGIGLQNMKDRVDALHGTMTITTKQGFKIFITIPKVKKE